MSKQTAVEWLEWQINLGLSERGLISAIKQAKQMEKEQIIGAFNIGEFEGVIRSDKRNGTDYYNETFGETKN
jgi:hypothetical protein